MFVVSYEDIWLGLSHSIKTAQLTQKRPGRPNLGRRHARVPGSSGWGSKWITRQRTMNWTKLGEVYVFLRNSFREAYGVLKFRSPFPVRGLAWRSLKPQSKTLGVRFSCFIACSPGARALIWWVAVFWRHHDRSRSFQRRHFRITRGRTHLASLFLLARPGAPSSKNAPSSDARSP